MKITPLLRQEFSVSFRYEKTLRDRGSGFNVL